MSLLHVREALRLGQIQCDRLGAPGIPLDPWVLVYDDDDIRYLGEKLVRKTTQHTYLLNKPKNVTTTTRDPKGKRDVSEWLAQMEPGTFPVGRLDRESTGALLFTTDGELATAILHPNHLTKKAYWLWLNEHFAPDDSRLRGFTSGVTMLGSIGKAEKVEIVSTSEDMSEVLVTLAEGKNRQIRRMCRALNLRLLHLHRLSIGHLGVRDLPLGAFRKLTGEEVAVLWRSAGGRERVERQQLVALRQLARGERARGAPDHRLEDWLQTHDLWEEEPSS